MEAIGGISGILTLIDTGFSLAKALNTYISEVSESRDDLVGLCADIDSTFNNLKELANVVQQNEQTQVWSDHGLANARKCAHDADVVIKKMRKLVQKGGVSVQTIAVEPEQIDIQKFRRLLWPMYKGELEVRRRELQSIKLDIVIAYTSYNAKAADTSSARLQAENDLPRLQHAKASMKKDLKRARRKRKSRTRSPDYNVRYHSPPGSRRSHSKSTVNDAASVTSSDIYGAPGEIIYECVEDVVKDFEIWQKEKEDAKKAADAELKRIQEEAVARWKQEQDEEAAKQRAQIQIHRDRVREELARQQIAPQRIEEILNHVYPFPSSGYVPITTSTQIQPDMESLVSSGNSDKTGTGSLWSKFGRRRVSSAAGQGRRESVIPSLLQDPTSPGGLAQLKALYFQRMLGPEGERVQQIDVDIPEQWLLQKILFKDTRNRTDTKSNSIWRDFAQLPDDYRYCITNELKRKQISANSHIHGEWVLIYAEPQRRGGSRRKFLSTRKMDIIGVYIVLKKVPRSLPALSQTTEPNKETEEKTAEIKASTQPSAETPEPKIPKAPEPILKPAIKFPTEPQHASFYTPREEPEPEPIQLKHASRRSQSQGEPSVQGDRTSRSRSPVPTATRTARFSDEPVSGTAYFDRWDAESQSTARPQSHADPISPVPPLIAYPSVSRSSSQRRSSDRPPSVNSAHRPFAPDSYYDGRSYGPSVPSPPLEPQPYYGDEILVDTLGTAWDHRRRSSFDSLRSFGSRSPSPRRYSGKSSGSRSRSRSVEAELKRLEEELRETRDRRYRNSRSRDSDYETRVPGYLNKKHGEIVIRRDITKEREKLPTRLYESKPPSRRSTFESDQSQTRYGYGHENRNGPSSSAYVIETEYYRDIPSHSTRFDSTRFDRPGPIIIRDGSRTTNPLYRRVRSPNPESSLSSVSGDDDTVSLSSYDGGGAGEKWSHRRTSAADKKMAQSMLEQLTNKSINIPLKKPPTPKSPIQDRPVKLQEQRKPTWESETTRNQALSEEPRIIELSTDNMTPLEEAQLKLERLNNRLAISTATADILTASDLKYYAIPDQQKRIKELEEQEISKQKRIKELEEQEMRKQKESDDISYKQKRLKELHKQELRNQRESEPKQRERNIHNRGKKKVAHVESDEDSEGGGTPQRRITEELDTDDVWDFRPSQLPKTDLWRFTGPSAATKKPVPSSDQEQSNVKQPNGAASWDSMNGDDDWGFWGSTAKKGKKSKKKNAHLAQLEDLENGVLEPNAEVAREDQGKDGTDDDEFSIPVSRMSKKDKKKKKAKPAQVEDAENGTPRHNAENTGPFEDKKDDGDDDDGEGDEWGFSAPRGTTKKKNNQKAKGPTPSFEPQDKSDEAANTDSRREDKPQEDERKVETAADEEEGEAPRNGEKQNRPRSSPSASNSPAGDDEVVVWEEKEESDGVVNGDLYD